MSNDSGKQQFVGIEPTPQGYHNMHRIFEQTIKDSAAKITQVEEFRQKLENWHENWHKFADDDDEAGITQMVAFEILFGHRSLLSDALEALESQERKRIASMQDGLDGLDELAKGGY